MSRRFEFIAIGLILIAYLGIASLYATRTPDWEVPDEPAHYNYTAQIAAQGCCLKLQPGDWNNDYLTGIISAKFAPVVVNGQIGTVRYEDHQPPLYYLLQSVVFKLTQGNLHALRLFSVLLGAGVVVMAWLVVRTIFPTVPVLGLAAAAFVAFLPQHVAMMAGVENDSLAELLAGVILWLSILYVGNGSFRPHPALLGLLVGIGFLTKVTIYPTVAIAGLAIVLRGLRERWTLADFARTLALFLIPALILGGLWWLRNIATYGFPDFLGLKMHDSVVVGQPRTSEWIARLGFGGWLKAIVPTTFDSFWGQFGWMGVPMPMTFYTVLLVFTALVIVGAIIALIRYGTALAPVQRDALILLLIAGGLALAEFIYYNLTFVQAQGRYLYPGLIPLAAFVAIGLYGWVSLAIRRAPIAAWGIVILTCAFAVLDVYALYKFIIPALSL
jgi:4-amino-4-deoxy-L-arabinose transferase-like glycosyltransferase